MSIATRTGDLGTTALMYGRRVPKSHPRVEAYGTVDELNAALGFVRATADDPWVGELVEATQHELIGLFHRERGDQRTDLRLDCFLALLALPDRHRDKVAAARPALMPDPRAYWQICARTAFVRFAA